MIVNVDTLIEALIPHVEDGKSPMQCFCAVRDDLPPGIKRDIVEQQAKILKQRHSNTEYDFGKFEWEDFKMKIALSNKIADMVAGIANSNLEKVNELRKQPIADEAEYKARRDEVEALMKEVDNIQSLLRGERFQGTERVSALLSLLTDEDMVAEATELFEL